jgi:hypothetical protein
MERVYIELWNPLIRLLNDAQAWVSLSSLSFMLKDAGDAQAQACLSILSINRLALQAWRPAPSLPVTYVSYPIKPRKKSSPLSKISLI